MDLHCKRCPQCISHILSLTADITSFRVKYFKPKKKNPLFKYCWHSYGSFKYPWLFPEVFLSTFSFLFPFSHLSLSTHLSYDAFNLNGLQAFPEIRPLLNYHKSIKNILMPQSFLLPVESLLKWIRIRALRWDRKWKHVVCQDTVGLYRCVTSWFGTLEFHSFLFFL